VRARRHDAARHAAAVFRAAVILTAVLAAGLIVAAPILCVTVFGSEFRGSIEDLRVLALGAFGIVALKQLGNALTAQRHPTLASIAIGVGFVSTVILDVVLIPPYGGLGAALASSLSYTAGGIAVAVIFSRALGISPATLLPRFADVAALSRTGRELARRALPAWIRWDAAR
jgi:O-antigen/teichoic acid export membrane protein